MGESLSSSSWSKILSNSSESSPDSKLLKNLSPRRRRPRIKAAGWFSFDSVGQASPEPVGGVRGRRLVLVKKGTVGGITPEGETWRRGYTKNTPRRVAIRKKKSDCDPCSDSNVSIDEIYIMGEKKIS